MNTKYIMAASAAFMGAAGALLLFIPEEILTFYDLSLNGLHPLILQLLGAFYLSFAMLNWMARGNIIGGIYSKPVSMGNFAHFFIGGLSILKEAFMLQDIATLWAAAVIYSVFAILFGIITFGNPLSSQKTK